MGLSLSQADGVEPDERTAGSMKHIMESLAGLLKGFNKRFSSRVLMALEAKRKTQIEFIDRVEKQAEVEMIKGIEEAAP